MSTQTLDIISVNLWQILISLANLLILFLGLKKFLYKPVKKIIADRQAQVAQVYCEADENLKKADSMKAEYESRLAGAREEADTIVRNATQSAQIRSDAMLAEAGEQVSRMKQKAEEDIRQERRQMVDDVRGQISDLAVNIASKIVEREVKKEDHENFVEEFIKNVGDES